MIMKRRKIVSDILEELNALRLNRCIVNPSDVDFTKPGESLRKTGENIHSEEAVSSISVLEYLERVEEEIAGGQEKT